MEHTSRKARRKINFRGKHEIIKLLEEYEIARNTISVAAFCKSHDVPSGTFYTWQKHLRQGKYPARGKFIELSVEEPIQATPPVPALFASLSIGPLTIQLHQQVSADYIGSLLNKYKL